MKYAKTSGREIAEIIEAIKDTLSDYDDNAVGMSCITLAILMYNPEIELKHLHEAVKQSSEFIAILARGNILKPS